MRTGEIEIKITDHDDNNNDIITQEFNILIAGNFAAKLKQASLATKTDIDNFAEKADFTSNKAKTFRSWKTLIDPKNKIAKYQKMGMIFCRAEFILHMMTIIRIF